MLLLYTVPVRSLNANNIDTEVLTLFHCDHLRSRLEAELLHHGLEVVLTRTLEGEKELASIGKHKEVKCIIKVKELSSYQVVEGEEADVLSQQVGAELSSTQRQKDSRQWQTLLGFDLQYRRKTETELRLQTSSSYIVTSD